ncbi:MAG: class I SAM-dependent methyltransferase [Candidatus Margulisbacteria bacterium]|nr:class I SAM-dependent methyltransferase [Candidatus Margulisiibacteriota bacterium]
MFIKEIYNYEFVDETQKIRSVLDRIKSTCEEFDRISPNLDQQIDFINKHKENVFSVLDEHFLKIWQLSQDFSEEEMQRHRKLYQNVLIPYFEVSPYNKRVYDKPLGYAGDYVLMIYLYENGYEGDSTYAKLIHRYSMHVPEARANHNRKDFYKKRIIDAIKDKSCPRIASIASGPAIEIVEVLSEIPAAQNAIFTLLDFEPLALKYVKEQVDRLAKEKDVKFNIQYINANIKNLLRPEKVESLLDQQDMIYSSGLIDYFSDKIAARIIEVFYLRLKPGARLILGNVSAQSRHRAFTEILGEWFINYRTEDVMIKLTEKINDVKNLEITHEEETKMNIFLTIHKL